MNPETPVVPAQGVASAQAAPLFAAIDGRVSDLGNGEAIFFDPQTDKSHVMTRQVLQALGMCRDFQPMSEHVARICKQIPELGRQPAAVEKVLHSLASLGLMVSDDSMAMRMQRAGGLEPAAVSGLFLRTCDRPDQLQAMLESLAGADEALRSVPRLVVVDDSRNEASRQRHEQMLAEFARRSPMSVHYVGPTQAGRLVDDLAEALPEHAEAIRAAVFSPQRQASRRGGGQGRNLITLLSAGSRYLLLDDDCYLPIQRHPEGRDQLGFGPGVWGIRTYASHAEALEAGALVEDAVERHLQLCGHRLGELAQPGAALSFNQMDLRGSVPSLDPAYRGDARVAITLNGHRGATGSAGIAWQLLLDATGRAGYAADEQHYTALRSDVPVWFGHRRFYVHQDAKFTPFAIDNGSITPCTTPYGRGEDAVFNALVTLGDPDSVHLATPWTVAHRPSDRRDRSALFGQPETPDFNHCLTELVSHVSSDLYAAGAAPRYALMAARLDDLAAASDAATVSYLREYLAYRRSTFVRGIQQLLQSGARLPKSLAEDLAAQVQLNAKAIVDRPLPRLAGWSVDADSQACAAAFREETGVLAAALRAWPAAWALARQHSQRWLAEAQVKG